MSDHGAKPEEHAAEGGDKPKKSKKGLFIGLGVVVLALGAGVPMFLMGGEPSAEESAGHEEEEKPHEKHLETAELGIFIVNLSESTSFLKTKMTVEFDPEIVDRQTKKPEGEEGAAEEGGGGHGGGDKAGGAAPLPEFMAHKETQIKDTVIRVLSSKHTDEMLTGEGKERLKEELVEGVNEAVGLEDPAVNRIFFTEFIIQ